MQRVLLAAIGASCFSLVLISSAQSPQPPDASVYGNRCASCHGADMNGASGPAIRTWVRFHVDKEIVGIVGARAITTYRLQMPDPELRQLLSESAKARRHQSGDGDGRLHGQPHGRAAA